MIGVLVVDDELIIRRGIRSSIDWTPLGVEILGEAGDGHEALEEARRLRPDLVLADIRMPIMDGLELTRRLREELPETEIILISGYDEFEYAQRAIEYGVTAYLLKPVGADELIDVVRESVARIRKQRGAARTRTVLQQNLDYARAALVGRFLRSDGLDSASFLQESAALDLALDGSHVRVVRGSCGKEVDQLLPANRDLLDRVQNGYGYVIGEEILLFACGDADPKDELRDLCDKLIVKADAVVTFGVGGYHAAPDGLKCSYREAGRALDAGAFSGLGRTYVFDELGLPIQEVPFRRPERLTDDIGRAVLDADTRRVIHLVNDYTAEARSRGYGFEEIREDFRSLVVQIISLAGRQGRITPREESIRWEAAKALTRTVTLRELSSRGRRLLEELIQTTSRDGGQSRISGVAAFAVNYAGRHYHKPLRARDMARMARVTPNYFSRAFKSDMGIGFIQWLNRYRIEKSKDLLADVGARVYEVAADVGFANYRYFASLFKKETGRTPKEYQAWRAAHPQSVAEDGLQSPDGLTMG